MVYVPGRCSLYPVGGELYQLHNLSGQSDPHAGPPHHVSTPLPRPGWYRARCCRIPASLEFEQGSARGPPLHFLPFLLSRPVLPGGDGTWTGRGMPLETSPGPEPSMSTQWGGICTHLNCARRSHSFRRNFAAYLWGCPVHLCSLVSLPHPGPFPGPPHATWIPSPGLLVKIWSKVL